MCICHSVSLSFCVSVILRFALNDGYTYDEFIVNTSLSKQFKFRMLLNLLVDKVSDDKLMRGIVLNLFWHRLFLLIN